MSDTPETSEPKAKKLRRYQPIWQEQYACVPYDASRVLCTICGENITCRTYNVKRHYSSKHGAEISELGVDEQLEFLKQCVQNFGQLPEVKEEVVSEHQPSTRASFAASLELAKRGKPFTDGEFLKKFFLSCSEELFSDFPNKANIIQRIQEMPLSGRTVQRRIDDMANDIDKQLKQDMSLSDVISFSINESTDINSVTRLAIVARYGGINTPTIHEELCVLTPLQNSAKETDILHEILKFTKFENGEELDLQNKIFSVTTDGSEVMVNAAKILEKQFQRPLLIISCLIEEEKICANASSNKLNEVMNVVVKAINIIVKYPTQDVKLRSFLDEIHTEYGDLLLHAEIKWLSRGKILNRFLSCINAIQEFLGEIGENIPELEDGGWVFKLKFLADITNHLNTLNLRLKDKEHTILKLYEEFTSFCWKIVAFENDIRARTFKYFPNVKSHTLIEDEDVNTIMDYISAIHQQFESRFESLKTHGPMFPYLIKPDEIDDTLLQRKYFEYLGIDDFDMELIDFRSSVLWTDKFKNLREELEKTEVNHLTMISTCWASLPAKFFSLKRVAFALLTAFGSTYSCEQVFSQMKHIVNTSRNRLSAENCTACVKLNVTKYKPNLNNIQIQGQGSH